ncbi:hypothetical protein BOTBODRAFT_473278 [Botryobasidium botryosum FD-172 SS1]|uniref:Anaphase-promoting complex subunit 5 domain-containing protein n=1 Tax=Botryobasidium botryosum (strain FD-172 SS1) TaxID=930990 RepID=A0A067M7U0_BOTB1|nr:hypothetical protein BOTBODRAFT_473278 [Botryobasidium botryosum FD-172 SS1]
MARDLARDHRIRAQISLVLEADQSLATAPLSRQFGPLIRDPCLRYPSVAPMVAVVDGLDEGYSVELLKLLRDGIPNLPPSFRLFITSREMEPIELYLSKSAHVHLQTIDLGAGTNLRDIRTYILRGCRGIAEMHDLGGSWPGEGLIDRLFDMAGGLFQWASVVLQALELSYDPAAELATLLAGLRTGLGAEEKMDEIYSKILQACDWKNLGFKRDYGLAMGAILALKSPLSSSALQTLHPGIPNISKLLSRLGALLTGWRHPNQPVRILHLSLRDFLTARTPSSAPFYICEKDHSQRLGLLTLAFLNENLKHSTPGAGYLESDSPGIPTVFKDQISKELWYSCEFWTAHVLGLEAPAPTELAALLRAFISARLISWMEVCTSIDTFKGFQQIRIYIQSNFPEDTNLMNDEFKSRLGNALNNISGRLSYMDRREEALLAVQEAVVLFQQLAKDRPVTFNSDLAFSLHGLSIRLSDLGQQEEALAAIREAVALYRQLAKDRPAAFNSDLASSLNNLSAHLSALGQREEALAAIREAVALYRQLANDRPAAFNPTLAVSLHNLSEQQSGLGQREDALAAIQEAVALHRQLANDRPATFNPNFASSLLSLSSRLSDLGQREDALAAIRESLVLYRQLAKDRPAAFSPNLAKSLIVLSNRLSELGQREEALAAIREAVALYRQLANDRPAAFSPDLAMSLNNLSARLSDLGQREDALAAIREAVALYRQLANDRPAAFNPDFAGSLNNLSLWLSDLGQREEALAAIREAVALRRQLANDRPAAFNPDLAMSLNNLSARLSELGQREDALAAIREAVALRRQLANDRPAAFNHYLARSLYNLSRRLSALDHREEALAAAKEAVALYRPFANDFPAVFKSRFTDSLRLLSWLLRALGQEDDAVAAEKEADMLDSPQVPSA